MRRPDREALEKMDKSELISIIEALWDELEAFKKEVRESISKRSAPFSKGKGKAPGEKKRSGRRRGQGKFTNREAPEAKANDQVEHIEVKLDQTLCEKCGTPLEITVEEATIIDVPTVPVREIKCYHREVGVCPKCGAKVRAAHPDLPDDQQGATAHRVGSEVMSQALTLHFHHGLPLRKVPGVIEMATGVSLTPGGISQYAAKLCEVDGVIGKVYTELREMIAQAPVVNTDDTGWRIGGKQAFLMGFFTKDEAVYQVRRQHRHEEVLEVLGEDFEGILGTDRGTSYEAAALDEIRQQKCLSHLIKNLSEVEEKKKGGARWFAQTAKALFREGLALWDQHRNGEIDIVAYKEEGGKLKERIKSHFRDRQLSDPDNQRMLDGIGNQIDRGRALLFLDDPEVEPTNNRAERGLRTAVIARKVSQCSRTDRGAHTYEAMKSVVTTLYLRGKSVASSLASLIRTGSLVPCR